MASMGSGILRADVLGAGSREDQGVSPRAALRWGFEINLFTSKVKKKSTALPPTPPGLLELLERNLGCLQVIPNPTQMPLNTPGKAAGAFGYLNSWSNLTGLAL